MSAVTAAKAQEQAFQFDHTDVAQKTVEQHIRPGYRKLADAMAGLQQTANAFCAKPEPGGLPKLFAAYKDAVLAWSRMEHLRFGPVTQEHRYERIAFWPDPKGIGRKQVFRTLNRKDKSVLSAESLAKKSVALQGLTALEVLIHRDEGARLLGEKGKFRCDYAKAISANLVAMARDILDAWNTPEGFSHIFLNPGEENEIYLTPKEVTQEIVKAYGTGLFVVRNLKIGAPLGLVDSGKVSDPQYKDAGLDRAVIIANLEGIRDLFISGGLAGQLDAQANGSGEAVANEFGIAIEIFQDLDMSLSEVAETPEMKQKVAVSGFALKNAYTTGTGKLNTAAGLSIGFNALDGD